MRIASVYTILGAALLAWSQAGLAQEASVKIMSPAEGARFEAMAKINVAYEVMPGPNGDHVHL